MRAWLLALVLLAGCVAPLEAPAAEPEPGHDPLPQRAQPSPPPLRSAHQLAADVAAGMPPCASATPLVVSPIPLDDVPAVRPLGHLNPPEHAVPSDHIYFEFPRGEEGGAPTRVVPVLAPADARVTRIEELVADRNGSVNVDYHVHLAVCREVTVWLGHLSTLGGAVEAAWRANDARECRWNNDTARATSFQVCEDAFDLPVRAGEDIGTGGGKAIGWFDVGARDTRRAPLWFANTSRWPDNAHAVCPLELFEEPAASALRAKLAGPDCGAIAQDVAGTLAGAWGTSGVPEGRPPWYGVIGFFRDSLDPATGVVSVGGPLPSGAWKFAFEESGDTNPRFDRVSAASRVVCYEGLEWRTSGPATYLARLEEDGALLLERVDAPCAEAGRDLRTPVRLVR